MPADMPHIRFRPHRASEPPEWIPEDAEDDAPAFPSDAPDRPEDPGGQARRRSRWGMGAGAALTVAATGGALVWGRRRLRRTRD